MTTWYDMSIHFEQTKNTGIAYSQFFTPVNDTQFFRRTCFSFFLFSFFFPPLRISMTGNYDVALDESHFADLIRKYATPPPIHAGWVFSIFLQEGA